MEIKRLKEKKSAIRQYLQAKTPYANFDHPVPGSITRDFHMLGYHHGNRSPRADPTLRGMISGLSLNSSLQSLALRYFASLQSICYGTRHIIEVMNNQGFNELRAVLGDKLVNTDENAPRFFPETTTDFSTQGLVNTLELLAGQPSPACSAGSLSSSVSSSGASSVSGASPSPCDKPDQFVNSPRTSFRRPTPRIARGKRRRRRRRPSTPRPSSSTPSRSSASAVRRSRRSVDMRSSRPRTSSNV